MYLTSSKLKGWRIQNTPDLCPILLRGIGSPVVDHDHRTGEVRGVLSSQANVLLGKIENTYRSTCTGDPEDLPATLRRIADYLERDATGILHPVGAKQLGSRFRYRLTSAQQQSLLIDLGVERDAVDAAGNSTSRQKLFLIRLKEIYNGTRTESPAGDTAGAQGSEEPSEQIRRVLLPLL